VVLTVPSFWGVARAVSRSDLIALLVADFAAAMAEPMGLTLYRPPIPIEPTPICLVWHRKSDAASGHAWVRDLVMRVLSPLSDGAPPPFG
jgi:DNA-binding transcriptional LysR family regulator